MKRVDVDLVVDVVGEICPRPLIETRKSIKKASIGHTLEIIGTDPSSKKEIRMAMEMLKNEVISIEDDNEGRWHIKIRKLN